MKLRLWLKGAPVAGLWCEARMTWRKKIENQVHLVFNFRLRVSVEPECFLRALCASSDPEALEGERA